jgi:hypothetical protein
LVVVLPEAVDTVAAMLLLVGLINVRHRML